MQSRAMSALEAATNVAVGWMVALATQLVVFPAFGLQASLSQNIGISTAFTAVSLIRSYLLRRLFERFRLPALPGGPIILGETGGATASGGFCAHGRNCDRGSRRPGGG